MTDVPTPQLDAAGGESDQVPRLLEFRRQHPDVRVEFGGPFWQAIIPEPRGETVITRYELKALLDKLDELLP
jgi:hypothetical protein